MNMKKSLLIAVGFVLILSTVLAGCGCKSGGGQGKTLIYGRGADSPQLDPALVTDGESFRVTENVMETLVEYKKKSMEVKPGLAKDWEQSDDGKTWTFHLREGIQFHDGTPFNAEAVVKLNTLAQMESPGLSVI